MKKLFTTIALSALALSSWAQTQYNLKVVLKNGTVTTYKVADVDSIAVEAIEDVVTPPTQEVKGTFMVVAPQKDAFTASQVYKVMNGKQQVAEVAYEYIKPADKRLVVFYPMGANGKADLTKGVTANGGSVVWDLAKNTCSYTEGSGSDAIAVFVKDGNITADFTSGATKTELVADVINDKRGAEEKTYSIVKIGTQYWMAENLATAYYTDGTKLEYCTNADTAVWKKNTTGAYHIVADNTDNIIDLYGCMYNGYVAVSGKIAPEGWTVPSYDDWAALKTYGGKATNFKSDIETSWANNGEGTNLTGFSALPGGYFEPKEGDQREGSQVNYWTSYSEYDALSRANAIAHVYMTGTGGNVAMSKFALHDYLFGHYIRCIRK